jgi:hypothetical protein
VAKRFIGDQVCQTHVLIRKRPRRCDEEKAAQTSGRTKLRFVPSALGSEANQRRRVPLTTVSASVSMASISFPSFTTTKLKFISERLFDCMVAVPMQFLATE